MKQLLSCSIIRTFKIPSSFSYCSEKNCSEASLLTLKTSISSAKNYPMQNSKLLQLMGLPKDEDDISYDICLDLSNASWDEVSSRITMHPAEAIEEDRLHGNSPIEIMIKSKSKEEIPLDVYRKLLSEGQEESGSGVIHEGILTLVVRKQYSDEYMANLTNLLLNYVKNADGRGLLEMCIWYGNVAAAKVVIQRLPEALSRKDHIKGQLPLHIACEESNNTSQSELVEILLSEGLKNDVGGKYGAGGLFEKDYKGTSPLMQVIHMMNNPFTWDAQLFEICVKTAYQSSKEVFPELTLTGSTTSRIGGEIAVTFSVDEIEFLKEGIEFHFPILHEAMRISSPDAFYRIIEIVKNHDHDLAGKDRRGRTALVKAIYLDAEGLQSNRKNQYKRKTSTKEIISMIIGAVTSDCAKVRDGAGRLPINIATELGLSWEEGVGDIVFANKNGLEERHCVTGLFPFMTAAVGPERDLTTIFKLLRERPKVARRITGRRVHEVSTSSSSYLIRSPVHWPVIHGGGSWDEWTNAQTNKTHSTAQSESPSGDSSKS